LPDRGRAAVLLAAIVTGLAGIIHLSLIEEHFEESTLFGIVFLAMAAYQLVVAGLLVGRPGPRAYQAGILGSALIVATYVATRVLPPPTADVPEDITPIGVVATTLELAALILLALALPEAPGRRWPIRASFLGVLAGLATPPLWAFVTGALQWTQLASPGAPALDVFDGPVGLLLPAVYGYVTDHLYLFLPWWAGIAAAALGLLVGGNVWLATRLRREQRISCRRQRVSVLGFLPAAFTASTCCSVPLAALFGLSTATLFAAAPWATLAAIVMLSANLGWLWRRRGDPARFRC
jgi:hypothetical protein